MEQIESSEISRSLLTEMTTLGVDDWLFVMNVCIAIIMVMILRIHAWAVIGFFLHFVLMIVTKMVPNILYVYAKYLRQAGKYCARLISGQKRGFRPLKFGKGLEQ